MNKETFETYREISNYAKNQLIQDNPSSFNGVIQVRKYRVTVELVEEPVEVIRARIQKLWDECKNPHHWQPLENEAKKYGIELNHMIAESEK